MQVTFLQTCDPIFYYPILAETSRTVREYCIRKGIRYEQYVGLKRGHMPWNSAFNRVFMLKDLLDRGYEGWAFYLDADAYIEDMNFDIAGYLSDKSGYAGIFAGYINDVKYDINSGGFAVNLSTPTGKGLALDYYNAVMAIPDDRFDAAIYWDHEIPNDQHLLMDILERYVKMPGVEDQLLFERSNQSYVNAGPFIKQDLRSMYPSHAARLEAIKVRVANIMRAMPLDRSRDGSGIYIPAGHPRIVAGAGRKTAFGVVGDGESGGLIYGPYMRLAAGTYVVKIYGDIDGVVGISSDVAHQKGEAVLSQKMVGKVPGPDGVIVEHRFSLDEQADDLEIRVMTEGRVKAIIHAIQIIPQGKNGAPIIS